MGCGVRKEGQDSTGPQVRTHRLTWQDSPDIYVRLSLPETDSQPLNTSPPPVGSLLGQRSGVPARLLDSPGEPLGQVI